MPLHKSVLFYETFALQYGTVIRPDIAIICCADNRNDKTARLLFCSFILFMPLKSVCFEIAVSNCMGFVRAISFTTTAFALFKIEQ